MDLFFYLSLSSLFFKRLNQFLNFFLRRMVAIVVCQILIVLTDFQTKMTTAGMDYKINSSFFVMIQFSEALPPNASTWKKPLKTLLHAGRRS